MIYSQFIFISLLFLLNKQFTLINHKKLNNVEYAHLYLFYLLKKDNEDNED